MAKDNTTAPFGRLDFVYSPRRDVPAHKACFTDALGARLVFAIDEGGTKVAMIELSDDPPRILLADHLEGDQPILIYAVDSLKQARADLRARGWKPERTLEIPPGPACTFRGPGGHRIALYEPTRLGVIDHFAGRNDF
jgi:hypothetical protein